MTLDMWSGFEVRPECRENKSMAQRWYGQWGEQVKYLMGVRLAKFIVKKGVIWSHFVALLHDESQLISLPVRCDLA